MDIAQRQLDLMAKTGYPLVQENGQTRFGPPPDWTGPPPPKGSEVFIAKLPRDVLEDELVPLFSTIGQIYQLRLMMDFSGFNRGFAFVGFTNPNDANQAIKELSGHEIRRGQRIAVVKSLDNHQLFIARIPLDATHDDVLYEMMQFSDEVVRVDVPPSTTSLSINRGYAFVEYTDHRAAAKARRALISNQAKPWGREDIKVDWAAPNNLDDQAVNQTASLYFGNLKPNIDLKMFLKFVTINGVVKVKLVRPFRGYCFVDYDSIQDAQCAFHALQSLNDTRHFGLNDRPLIIGRAKPSKSQTNSAATSPVLSRGMVKFKKRGISPPISLQQLSLSMKEMLTLEDKSPTPNDAILELTNSHLDY